MEGKTIPVMISVISSARGENGVPEETLQLIMKGELTPKPDGWLLHYEETLEDDADHTRVTHDMRLLLRPGHVTILRKGMYGMMMVLSRGKRYEGVYHTPYGDMPMAVYPTRVHCVLGPDHGEAEFEYQLDIQGGFVSVRRMTVAYTALEDVHAD